MSWNRYDDRFTTAKAWDGVSFAARWHYMALVELCGSTERYDGTVPFRLALGCSDVPDPAACIDELVTAGVLTTSTDTVTVATIDEHIPPPGERQENLLPRKRKNTAANRKRKCENGEHSRHCPLDTCPARTGSPPGIPVTPGRDGTGPETPSRTEEEDALREVDAPPSCCVCGQQTNWLTADGRCRRCHGDRLMSA